MSRRAPDARKRVLLLVLLGVAVVALPGRLAWSMRSNTVDQTDQLREDVRAVRERVTLAKRDDANQADLKEQLALLGQAMPADADLPSVVEALASLAADSGVSWRSSSQAAPAVREAARSGTDQTTTTVVRPAAGAADAVATGNDTTATTTPADAAGAPTPVTGSFTVEVDVAGTAEALTTYLDKVRTMTRLITVERLSFAWSEAGANAKVVTAHFSLKAYTWAGAPRPASVATSP